jgi:hypothetical protein
VSPEALSERRVHTLSEAGPTTRQFVDANNNPVVAIGGQNADGSYVAGSTQTDINGIPIVVALDSSVQSIVTAMSTANTTLASIEASATALVTASATEVTLLGEIYAGMATAAGQATAASSLSAIATNTSGAATDAHLSTLIADVVAGLAPLATDAHLVAQTAAIGTGNTTLAAILAKQPTLNGDGGAPAQITNFPATQAVTPRAPQNLTMTAVAVPANTSVLAVAANATRKSLQILNIGTGFASAKTYAAAGTGGTVPTAPGQTSATSNTVTLGAGYPLEVASSAGHQGGSTPIYDGAGVSVDEWDVVAGPTATTVLVIEGN